MTNGDPDLVRAVPDPLPPGMLWRPVQGDAASGILARNTKLDAAAKRALVTSASQILGSGISPAEGDSERTGLVVGYVQSGKTLSFTTVMALARDNGFPIVVLIAGNKTSLLDQSHQRLEDDLDVTRDVGLPAWITIKNPRREDAQHEQYIQRAVANFRDHTLDPGEKPTVLLSVLKQNHRLAALTALLHRIDLRGVPVLIVDDEADQASLNTRVNQGNESTTYTRVCELRAEIPRHTYLEYTATPQALLLINIADTLSPDFVHVLEPGTGYVGGETFFGRQNQYVRTIPATDLAQLNVGQPDPPESLVDALRLYFVGLAVSLIRRSGRRAMLIHPARERVVHQESAEWATAMQEHWKRILALADGDQDRAELIDEFRDAYDDLLRTDRQLPPFEEIVQKLPRALRNTTVIEFNTRGQPKTPEIQWRNSEGWILIGGQAVDRGFTVDALSVTYMPRGTGVGNADTLQQRARFFGYKRDYLGVCRIFLEADLRIAFEQYVEHEQFMRRELALIAQRGENLGAWRRRFILDPSLEPCRRSVIADPVVRSAARSNWTTQRGAFMDAEVLASNRRLLDRLVAAHQFANDTSYQGVIGPAQQHTVAQQVRLAEIVNLLMDYRFADPRDTAAFTGLLLVFQEALRRAPETTLALYRMRPSAVGNRTVEADGSIPTIQQGETRLRDGTITYPGDRAFMDRNRVSVQLHQFNLLRNPADQEPLARAAPMLAVHIPQRLSRSWLIQVQPNQR